jgi:hypothetical protein
MNVIGELFADFRKGVEQYRAKRIARRQAMAQRWRVAVSFVDDLGDVETTYGPVETFDGWTPTPEKIARLDAEQSMQRGVWLKTGELVPPHRIALVHVSDVTDSPAEDR